MKRVVVDANIIVKWFIPEDYSEHARRIRDDHLYGCVEATAPDYARLEVYNALWKYASRGIIDSGIAERIAQLVQEVRVDFKPVEGDLALAALEYSLKYSVSVYDAYYITLAWSLDTQFYTADEKLLRRLEGVEPRIRHIVEYEGLCSGGG